MPVKAAPTAAQQLEAIVQSLDQVGQRARRIDPSRIEGGDVVVHAHVAEIDRRGLAVRDQFGELGRQLGHAGREVRLEDLGVDGPRQERVVDAPHHVTLRITGRQRRLRQHRAGVTGDQDLDGDAGLGGELGEGGVDRVVGIGRRERVVSDQSDRVGFVGGRRAVATTCPHGQAEHGEPENEQQGERVAAHVRCCSAA